MQLRMHPEILQIFNIVIWISNKAAKKQAITHFKLCHLASLSLNCFCFLHIVCKLEDSSGWMTDTYMESISDRSNHQESFVMALRSSWQMGNYYLFHVSVNNMLSTV